MAAENEPQDLPEEQPVTGGEAGAEAAQDAQDQEGLIEAEGPDVETSLSDADLSFLSGQSSAETLAAEHLADLQRVTAEYANYRKRTEANRQVDKERAIGDAVKVILPCSTTSTAPRSTATSPRAGPSRPSRRSCAAEWRSSAW